MNRTALTLLLAFGMLAGCGEPTPPPIKAVEGFYALKLKLAITGAPDPRELDALSPYLGLELRELLLQARKRHDDEAARAPADKPSFADGDLFSSLFEGPTSFKVGADETTGNIHRVSVQLAYDRQQPVMSWTDKVIVKYEDGKPVVFDIEYGGSWEFGNKGTLVYMLRKALMPDVAATVLGKWVVAGHRSPGTSAIREAQAHALHGQPLEYTAETATSGRDVCPHARYSTRGEAAGPYLATQFRVDTLKLGMEPDTKLDVTEVSCGGVHWTTLGGTLIVSPAGRAFAPWNGVFFELKRRQ